MKLLISALTLVLGMQAFARSGSDLPVQAGLLGEVTYEPQILNKLKNPELLWFDEDWFRGQGYKIDGAFEKRVLNEMGYAMPLKGEDKDAYTEDILTFYADRYGGLGINGHRGSGRAASRWKIQIKGVGRTSLVNTYAGKADEEHSTGRVDIFEGTGELVASQVADKDLPYGANKVVAMIATGTKYWDKDRRQWIPRVLIVREDPLRPAHFIPNTNSKGTQREQDRIDFVMGTVDRALPQAPGTSPKTRDERLQMGMDEFIYRHARVAAYSYANRYLHSAFSPSNEEMSGAALDYGAFMALEGYAKAGRFGEGEYNGETKAVEKVIREFVDSLKTNLPVKDRGNIPTANQAVKAFQEKYQTELNYYFVALTGMPMEILGKYRDRKSFTQLGDLLIEMAQDGNDKPIDALNDHIGRPGSYDLPRILQRLATVGLMSANAVSSDAFTAELNQAMKSEILDTDTRTKLVSLYVKGLAKCIEDGVNEKNLRTYVAYATELRNRRSAHLINDDSASDFWVKAINAYMDSGNGKALRQEIDDAVESSRRTFTDAEPMTLVLSEKRAAKGTKDRQVFSLKTGTIQTERVAAPNGCENRLKLRAN